MGISVPDKRDIDYEARARLRPGATMSSEEIQSVTRFTLIEGRHEEFVRLFEKCVDVVKTKDMGTLYFEAYVGSSNTEVVVIERYRDSASALQHLTNIGPELMKQVIDTTDSVAEEVFGALNSQLQTVADNGITRFYTPLS